MNVDCVATGARPEPIFKWYIGDKIYNESISTKVEKLEDDKGTYTSIFNYTGNPKDIAKMLKCEVIHKGYKTQQLINEDNVEEAQLNLSFKPARKPKITYPLKGDPNMVQVMFLANPMPSDGHWIIGEKVIEIDSSIDEFHSSPISDGDLEGEYQVTLNSTMDLRLYKEKIMLNVTNELGNREYEIELKVEEPIRQEFKPRTFTSEEIKKNESVTIQVLFFANPKPTSGQWSIENVAVSFGNSSFDGTFKSSEVQNGSSENQFSVELQLTGWKNGTGNLFQLQVENGVGKTYYNHTFSGDVETIIDDTHSQVVTKSQTPMLAVGIIIGIVITALIFLPLLLWCHLKHQR